MGKLHIISGDDDATVKARAKSAAAEACGLPATGNPLGHPALEIIVSDGNGVSFDEVVRQTLAALRTPSFFSEQQVIWLRGFGFFEELDKAYQTKGSGGAGELASLLTEPLGAEQTLILSGPGLDQRRSWAKALKAAGADIAVFNTAKSNDKNFSGNRQHLIQELCRGAGKKIHPDAVRYIDTVVGFDMEMIRREVEKLLCYAGDAQEITLADCRAVCSRTPEALVWNFTDALTKGNAADALATLDLLLNQGEAEIGLLAMTSKAFQTLSQARIAMQELGIGRATPRSFESIPEEVKAAHPDNPLLKMHPYRAFKVCENASSFTGEELSDILKAILNANRALVSSAGSRRMVLEQMIFSIAEAGKR